MEILFQHVRICSFANAAKKVFTLILTLNHTDISEKFLKKIIQSIRIREKCKTKKLENKTEPFIKVKAVRRPHSQQSTHHHQRKFVVFFCLK